MDEAFKFIDTTIVTLRQWLRKIKAIDLFIIERGESLAFEK